MRKINVVAAVIRKDDSVFATQRGYGDYKDGWEFPGGKIEPGETPQQALVREIRSPCDHQRITHDAAERSRHPLRIRGIGNLRQDGHVPVPATGGSQNDHGQQESETEGHGG